MIPRNAPVLLKVHALTICGTMMDVIVVEGGALLKQCIILAVIFTLCAPVSVQAEAESAAKEMDDQAMFRKQIVPPIVKSVVLREVSPTAVNRVLGETREQGGPSIRLDREYEWIPRPDVICPGIQETGPRIMRWYPAMRPDTENFVAIIANVVDEPAILNPPKYFVYNFIPRLEVMTRSQADELWGKPMSLSPDSSTYRLVSRDKDNKLKEFSIEIRFLNDHIKEYRITGATIHHGGWRKIEMSEER